MSRSLYTIVLDYQGGTYVGQADGESPHDAVVGWASSLTEEDARAWQIDLNQLQNFVHADELVPLSGVQSVWCLSGNINGNLALINVIRTAGGCPEAKR